jgi:hypothetical protein
VEANILNAYYASVFCCDRNIREIKLANSGETLIMNTQVIRKISKSGRNKSVGLDCVPDAILNLGGKALTN